MILRNVFCNIHYVVKPLYGEHYGFELVVAILALARNEESKVNLRVGVDAHRLQEAKDAEWDTYAEQDGDNQEPY